MEILANTQMNILRDPQEKWPDKERVLALGFFDGVHLGHQALLSKMREIAIEDKLSPAALTFSDAPAKVFRGDAYHGVIQTPEQRTEILHEQGAEEILALEPNKAILSLEPEEYLQRIILQNARAKALVCGRDHSFGKKGSNYIEILENFCQRENIRLEVISDIFHKGVPVSSTRIRQHLLAGEMEEATALMGRPFAHSSVVIQGLKLGRRLGFPTLNIKPDPEQILPPFGVYLTKVVWDGKEAPGVTNLGISPTVSDKGKVQSETYILTDYYPDYGDKIEVQYLRFTRAEEKYASLEELKTRVEQDIREAREAFSL